MTTRRPHSWRALILPLCLLIAVYLLARGIRSGATADIIWPTLLILALLMDLATGWRRRYWGP